MERITNKYGDSLLMVFDKTKLVNKNYDYMAVVRTGTEIVNLESVLIYHYEDNFEAELAYKIPPKTRKPAKLLSYSETMEMLERVRFAAIGCVIDGMPYTYSMNYVMLDGHMYFHTGRKGYKLGGINTRQRVNVVEDLDVAYNGTHNFRCAQIYGTLLPTEDRDLKKRIFQKYIDHLNPNHPKYVESMQETTLVYEITFDYIMGRINLFMPGDGK